jgi:hypothetical protein
VPLGTKKIGNAKFQDGGYYAPNGRKYKIPKDAVVKNIDDKSIKKGDFVRQPDGTILKVTGFQANMIAKASKSSQAQDFNQGVGFLREWAASPQNSAKLKLAEDAIARGIKNGDIIVKKSGDPNSTDPSKKVDEIEILGTFKPNFRERLAISEVVNKTGKGFGTEKYKIVGQKATEGYSSKTDKGTYQGTGSFVGGMTPQDYEQRATYERALAEGLSEDEAEKLATTTDTKQKAENRRRYLEELKYPVDDISEESLISDDFYKNRYQGITNAIENSFAEAGFRPAIGNDMLSGWEHYDAASYARKPRLSGIELEPEESAPQQFPQTSYGLKGPGWKPMPSTMGKFPAYQAAPEALGFLAGINPYSYYTPDYTHYEVAPPTLNIDAEIQSIDDTIAALSAQTTGNASVDNARRVALANQALQAKQQAFKKKQNYDAEARFKADIYNTDARTKENYLDVNAANTVFNEYMAGAQDAAEMERMAAISGLTNKLGKYYQDEYKKMVTFGTLLPDFYYDGRDLQNPVKLNPYSSQTFSSNWMDRYNALTQLKQATKAGMAKPQVMRSEPAPVIVPEITGKEYNPMVDNINKTGIKLPPGTTVLRPSFMPKSVKKGMFPTINPGYTDFGIPEIPSQEDFYLP